jgi:hypothetical protein
MPKKKRTKDIPTIKSPCTGRTDGIIDDIFTTSSSKPKEELVLSKMANPAKTSKTESIAPPLSAAPGVLALGQARATKAELKPKEAPPNPSLDKLPEDSFADIRGIKSIYLKCFVHNQKENIPKMATQCMARMN